MSDAPLARLGTPLPEPTPAQVQADLQATRERLKKSLDTLEDRLGPAAKWRQAVRKHPVLAIGGVFVAGYLLGRLWGRR